MSALLALAFGAGLLAPVNPCGFALLPAYLGAFLQDTTTATAPQRLRRALGTGAAITIGFSATLTAIGIALAAGLRALTGVIPWVAVAVGAVLVLAGASMVLGRGISLRLPGRGWATRLTGGRRMREVGFGVGYAMASASCTLGVLLAVVGAAVAAGTVAAAAAVFAAYAAGSAILLLALAVAAAVANTALSRLIGSVSRYVPRIAGGVLAASGIYLIAYWTPTLLGGARAAPSENPLTRLAAEATSWISTHQALVITIAAAVVATGALAAVMASRRRARSTDCCQPADTAAPAHPR